MTNCTLAQWLNGTVCTNCTPCASPLVTARPCGPLADTACRLCTMGFEAVDDACVPEVEMQETHKAYLFILLAAEVLVCACAARWWRRHDAHYMRLARI
jgi:hypothetical protein